LYIYEETMLVVAQASKLLHGADYSELGIWVPGVDIKDDPRILKHAKKAAIAYVQGSIGLMHGNAPVLRIGWRSKWETPSMIAGELARINYISVQETGNVWLEVPPDMVLNNAAQVRWSNQRETLKTLPIHEMAWGIVDRVSSRSGNAPEYRYDYFLIIEPEK
jgi:hypothetical protein